MSPERWERVCEILNDALEVPADERSSFLAESCRGEPRLRSEVESLLSSHQRAGSFVPGPFGKESVSLLEELSRGSLGEADGEELEPRTVGSYRIEERLGRGGMGTVYRAVRADREFEKRVAVKVLRRDLAGDDLVRRFRSERQILAGLEHPNVARLLDGGTTREGLPFLVMEYVEGRPLDRYCEEEELSLKERLELFRKVCAAVHVAHQNLVVHRDLKPANILVGEDGEPKLLDFGIAKLLRSEGLGQPLVATRPGLSPMTLSHASPEQVRGKVVTTGSDVYSLGVVLYQLLAGRLPYEVTSGNDLRRMAAEICDLEPPRPSAVAVADEDRKRLEGDLDMIVLKALRKEPDERYASAEQLARDLERYSRGLPVLAQGDSLRYRAGKFLRRHRLAVSAAVLAMVLTAAFIVALLVQQDRIRQEQHSSEEVARMLVDLFDSADPDRALGERLTARQLLDRGARSLDGRLGEDPEVRATLLETIGHVYRKLGFLAEAHPFLEEALELRRSALGPRHPSVAKALQELGDWDYQAGDYEKAEERFRQALRIQERRGGAPLVRTLTGLALVEQDQGEVESSGETHRRALAVARETLGPEDPAVARILVGRAGLEQKLGDTEAAQRSYETALEIFRGAYGERHPEVASTLVEIAMVLDTRQLFADSEALYRQVLDLQRELYEGAHPSLAMTLHSFASSLINRGRFADAEPLALEALEMRRRIYGEEHSTVAHSLSLLGLLRAVNQEVVEAEELLRRTVAIQRKVYGPDHHELAGGLAGLGELLVRTRRLEEGTGYLEEALRISLKVYGEGHAQGAVISTTLGMARERQGDLERAEELYRGALPILVETFGERHSRVATLRHNLGLVLKKAGRLGEAEEELRQAAEIYRAVHGDDHYFAAVALKDLAVVFRDQGRYDEGEAAVRESLEIYGQVFPPDYPWTATARKILESIQRARSVADRGGV